MIAGACDRGLFFQTFNRLNRASGKPDGADLGAARAAPGES
jgi:hypothetical protein